MPNITPYSNFHELNLDWLLQKMKELEEKVNNIVGGSTPATNVPNMDGTGSAGSAITYARGDHTHPSDTSRASVSALNDVDTKVDNHYIELTGDINAVDAKIAFTSAAPLVDGVASPGSSVYQARSDHVHPTDTSRASQTQVDTIQATVDAWAGSASPYAGTPEMDGAGSPGNVDAYARGNHVHPSDTSRLALTGGEITGDLDVDGKFFVKTAAVFKETAATGWLRVAYVPYTPGTNLDVKVGRKADSLDNYNETHVININISNGVVNFRNELSEGDGLYINKIRISDAGYMDIHVDNATASLVAVSIGQKIAPTKAVYKSIRCMDAPDWVANAPDGETLTEYTFQVKTEVSNYYTGLGKSWTAYRYNGVCMLMTRDNAAANFAAGDGVLFTLAVPYRPTTAIEFPSANNPDLYIRVGTNGAVTLYAANAVTSGDPASFTATWPHYN